MSKLDRQLDEVYGEKRVRLDWSRVEEMIDEVRQHLIHEIDAHTSRVPLDLRSIRGAPEALIDLLVECQEYAKEQGKTLSISTALPPMQDALYGRKKRTPDSTRDAKNADASRIAQSILDEQHSDGSNTLPIPVKKTPTPKPAPPTKARKPRPFWKRYAIHAAVILGLTAVVGLVEYLLVFNAAHDTVAVPSKTFEE